MTCKRQLVRNMNHFIPARGRKHAGKRINAGQVVNHFIPARGRKRKASVSRADCLESLYPREGTETAQFQFLRRPARITLSPRGDGNVRVGAMVGVTMAWVTAESPYPREGTETTQRQSQQRKYIIESPYPPRGGGNLASTILSSTIASESPYPREGTEAHQISLRAA